MSEEASKVVIGFHKCHLAGCGYTDVPVKVMKNGRACSICPECDHQCYCRSRVSDKLLRAEMRPLNQPAPKEAPASETKTTAKPAARPAARPAAQQSQPGPRRDVLDF